MPTKKVFLFYKKNTPPTLALAAEVKKKRFFSLKKNTPPTLALAAEVKKKSFFFKCGGNKLNECF